MVLSWATNAKHLLAADAAVVLAAAHSLGGLIPADARCGASSVQASSGQSTPWGVSLMIAVHRMKD
jgi:hypothetical protein